MKPFKTIEEQFELLESRGLSFSNKEKSKKFLLYNNYYNVINCYAKFFMSNDDMFIPGQILMKSLKYIIMIKKLSQFFSKVFLKQKNILNQYSLIVSKEKFKNQEYAYLIASNYNSNDILQVTKTISSLSSIISKYQKITNNPINHYIHNHGGVPFWILTNYMNFGQLLYFYKYLDDSLKNNIARDFSVFLADNLEIDSIQLTSSDLISFIENLIDLRNIVAHNNKLLGFKCKGHVHYIPELHDRYSISNKSSKQDVYNVFIAMQALLSKNQYALLYNTLLKRTNYLKPRLKTIDISVILDCLGFPSNWCDAPKLPQPHAKIEE